MTVNRPMVGNCGGPVGRRLVSCLPIINCKCILVIDSKQPSTASYCGQFCVEWSVCIVSNAEYRSPLLTTTPLPRPSPPSPPPFRSHHLGHPLERGLYTKVRSRMCCSIISSCPGLVLRGCVASWPGPRGQRASRQHAPWHRSRCDVPRLWCRLSALCVVPFLLCACRLTCRLSSRPPGPNGAFLPC